MRHATITISAELLAQAKAQGVWNEPSLCPDCDRDDIVMYAVRNAVWAEAGRSPFDGWVCPPCLSKRLGRTLMPDDSEILPFIIDGVEITGEFCLP